MAALSGVRTSTHSIICILFAVLFLTVSDSMIKWLSPDYPLHQIVLVRALVAISLTMVMVSIEGGIAILRSKRLKLHILRGCLIVTANLCFFLGLASMKLAEAMAMFFVAPLLITALSVPILGETVGSRRWLAVITGLCGVLIVLRPGSDLFDPAAVLPVFAACAYASSQIITRRLGITEKAAAMAFYIQFCFIIVCIASGLLIGGGQFAGGDNPTVEFLLRAWRWPDRDGLALMMASGVCVGFGGYLMSQAYRLSQANVVAPFEYAALPLGVLWGWLVWGDLPDTVAWAGIALIVMSGLFVFYREHVKGTPLASERPMPRNR